MKKKIEDITFDSNYLQSKYKKEIDDIKAICEELENDKSIRKKLKKFLKRKDKNK